ncbi:2 5 oligoadenylate synthetase [Porites harrisoni]
MDSFKLKPFPCTVCRKRFKTDNGRASHQRAVHEKLVMASRSKPFECTVCSKQFTTAKGRAAHHRAVHNGLVMASLGSKPFECTVCSKRFTTDNGRASHQNAVHEKLVMASRSKPFECTVCSKRFTTDNGRASHQRAVHEKLVMASRSKRFKCTICSKRFTTDDGRAFHQIAVHVEKVSDDIRKNSSLDLNKFICDELQPNEEFHRLCNDAVDSLYQKLQTDLPGTDEGDKIHNLIKGGSLAKGTAIKNDADLDCVMVMNSIDDASELREKLPDIKSELKSCLSSSIGDSWQLASAQKETRFSLQFRMSRYPGESVEVDLLPTFEANVRNIDERERFYSNMVLKDEKNWQYYSAALVLFQRDFVVKRPTLVKSLIRLVKYWRKTFFPKNSAMPSYLLELLTIHAWENANSPERFNIKIGFKAVMEVLINHQSLRVSWGDYYREDLIPSSVLYKVKSNRAYIIDPANPTNNLYDDVDWKVVEMVAKVTKRKPLLRNVPVALANWK